MVYFQKEEIFGAFQPGFVGLREGKLNGRPISGVSAHRNEDLDLHLELTSPEWAPELQPTYLPGEIRAATEELHFEHLDGRTSVAKGVVYHGVRSSSGIGKPTESVHTYTAHSLEVDCQCTEPPAYTIEWVGNLPGGFVWSGRTSYEENTSYSHRIGTDPAAVTLAASRWSGGGTSTLHVRVDEVDLYLMHGEASDDPRRIGQIIYKGRHSEESRKRIRLCLSFALGLPIVYYGHTDYSMDWQPTFMRAYDAMSIGGAMFKLHDLPPYPINDRRYANVIDDAALNQVVNTIHDRYDELRFNELSWAYWYAVCAPLHTAAVHFGGLIEKLQKSSAILIKADRKGLLDEAAWRELRITIRDKIAAMDLPDDVRPVLKNKVESLNQLPQNIALKRLLERLGLRIGKAELDAWRHRNMAAHGTASEDAVEVILNAKLLKILFHRMLAAVAYCSDRHIDYYNLEFPTRPLEEAVPPRPIGPAS